MEFKFAGQFVFSARQFLVGIIPGQSEIAVNGVQLYLTLDEGTGTVSFGPTGNRHFTIWQAADQPAWQDNFYVPFVIRGGNGLYLTQQDGRPVAKAANRSEALTFRRAEPGLFSDYGWTLVTESNLVLVMNLLSYEAAQAGVGQALLLERYSLPDVPNPYPTLEIKQKYTGFSAEDITPVYEKTQRYPYPGPFDFSWLYFPGPWDPINGSGLNGGFQLPSNCSNSNLRGVVAPHTCLENFSGADLTDADLSSCNVDGGNFVGATLAGTNLSDCLLRHCNFEGVDLSTAVVRGSDFRGANLKNASLARCDLRKSTFELRSGIRTNLEGTDFSSTDLNNEAFPALYNSGSVTPFGSVRQFSTNPNNLTKFRNAKLTFDIIKLDWSCLDLTGATIAGLPQDLSGLQASYLTAHHIDLSNRILKNAVFENADLSTAEENKLTNFRGADLSGAKFNGAKLSGANFSSAKLGQVPFDNADLTDAIFTDADLTFATFVGARLTGATLADAMLDGADFTGGAKLGDSDRQRAAVLSYANMRGAVLTGANLDNCDLSYAQWYGADAKGDGAITAQGASFADANLGALNLSQAKIRNANFSGAILIGANLTGADANAAKFDNAHLQGADFTGAILTGANFTGATIALEQGVPLGILDQKYSADLDNRVLSNHLKTALEQKGCVLLDHPSVSVDARGAKWTITNATQTPPPEGLGAAYAMFKIILTASGLAIYGSEIWVTQVDEKNQLQTISVPCSPTKLNKDICTLDRDTTFPNGHTYHEFNAGQYTWEELMTARAPVQPPQCVYVPGKWGCQPIQRQRL